jgi:hypothetical protein
MFIVGDPGEPILTSLGECLQRNDAVGSAVLAVARAEGTV